MIKRDELLCLDLGHGVNFDGGADGRKAGGCLEEEIINAIGTNLKVHLTNIGQKYVESRPRAAKSVNDSLIQRIAIENISNCKLFVSLHANVTQGGTGTEIYTYNANRLPEAEFILSEMDKIGFRNRGIKTGNNLAVISKTKSNAMLIEICFCDNKNDVELFKANIDKISRIIATAITGVDCVNISPTNPKKSIFKVQIGAFSDRVAAEKIASELKAKGYNTVIKEE